jgi:fatty-acyl-CoA synthase
MTPTEHTLCSALDDQARTRPDATALYYEGRAVTFAALREESLRVARGLADLGVQAGDRVSLWLPNTPAWLACLFACARLGAIALATNTRFRGSEMEDILGRSGANVLVYWPAFRGIDFSAIVEGLSPQAVAGLSAVVAYAETGDAEAPARLHGVPVHAYRTLAECLPYDADHGRPDTGCLMFTTSGTTKAPKFVLHRQASVAGHMRDVARAFLYDRPDTVGLCVLPLCGTYGFFTGLGPLCAGAPIVLEASFEPRRVLASMQRYRVTSTNLTGDMIGQLLAHADDESVLRRVRFSGCGTGAPQQIGPAQTQGLRVVGVYGSSEVHALFAHQNEIEAPLEDRAAGGGRPASPYAAVRVRNVETGALLPHGESGMLEMRTPWMLSEYFGNAEATREAFTDDGWFRTGDLGYTVADGRFVYQARMGDALRLSGFLVSPAQIESVVAEHPSVTECHVVGVDTPDGLKPCAFVTTRPGKPWDEAAVIAFARERMARYKVPARIVRVDAFPTTASANATKVQKAKLRDMAQAMFAQV